MKTSIFLVSTSYERLAGLSLRLSGKRHSVTLIPAKNTVQEARQCPVAPDAMLVDLRGDENVVALRALLEQFIGTRMLFTVPDIPPSAAVARLVRSHGGALMSRSEPDVITTATLLAMAAQDQPANAHA